MQPGVSIAAVALQYRLNANLLRRWIADHETQASDTITLASKSMPIQPAGFVPLQLHLANMTASTPDIVIQLWYYIVSKCLGPAKTGLSLTEVEGPLKD